ncbi:MAG: septal ring lytic transglycosylase RlpA family protein [Sphingorhabdus sp.]
MRFIIKLGGCTAALALLASCGGGDRHINNLPTAAEAPVKGASDFPVRIGSPYQVGSTTHTPADVTAYDEVGYASWYGAELQGRNTANGEVFLPTYITAAHKTLPMPSYVEITSLDTGRTILVRVNDRGPFANDRLIDLSEGAAKQLGITTQGVAGVRVRKVNPPETERAMLRNGQPASARIDTPQSLLKVLRDKLVKMPKPSGAMNEPRPAPVKSTPGAAPQPKPAPTSDGRFVREGASGSKPVAKPAPKPTAKPATTQVAAAGYVVQIAAFSSRARADELARKMGARVAASADGKLFRVRFGPFATEAEGQRSLADAQKRGYPQARLFRE